MVEKGRQFWYLYSALVILVLIRIIPFLFPASRTWGFNHLIFLSSGYSIAFFGFASVALILPFIKKTDQWNERFIDWFAHTFFECSRKYLNRAIFILPWTILFIVFTAPTHFLGDGYAILLNIASESNTLYKWSEIGIIVFLKSLRTILGPADMQTAKLTVHVVSVISGVISFWFFFGIAQYATENKTKRVLMFLALIFSGSLLLFFGYAEHYPLLWIIVSGLFYAGLKYVKSGKGMALLLALTVVGMIFHLQIAVFVPAIIYIVLFSPKKDSGKVKLRLSTWIILISCVVGIMGLFLYKYLTDLYFQAMFLGLFADNVEGADYTVFSISHLIDIINQSILLSPLLVIYLLGAKDLFSIGPKSTKKIFLVLAIIGSFAFILLIDPTIGMARDWDLFSFSFLAVTILSIIAYREQDLKSTKQIIFSILIIQILSPLPFILTNLQKDESAKYSEYIISQDINRSLGTLYKLHEYYEDEGNIDRANAMKLIYKNGFSRKNRCDSVISALKRGDIKTATPILKRIKPNKYDAYYQKIAARYYYLLQDYDKAMKYIDKLIQMRRYNADNYGDRAKIYIAWGNYDKALDDLRYGYNLNNESKFILDGLANLHFEMQEYDSTIYYSQKRLLIDSTSAKYYYLLAMSYAYKKDINMVQKYYNKFAEFNINNNRYKSRLNELSGIINIMKNN